MAKINPEIDLTLCTLCGDCVAACPHGAVEIVGDRLVLDEERCVYCGDCEDLCPMGAIALPYEITVVAGRPADAPSGAAATHEEEPDGQAPNSADR
jgi:formate hydrogenlyase subunit 6/NADH:ubiquinone oxidoreductase subunit I